MILLPKIIILNNIIYFFKIYNKILFFLKNNILLLKNKILILEYFPIFTNNLIYKNNKKTNIYDLILIYINRGGNITYHAPGQLIIYFFLNLFYFNNKIKKIKNFIKLIFYNIIKYYNIKEKIIIKNNELYIKKNKNFLYYKFSFFSIKIFNNIIFHGISLNISIYLKPFKWINPCGVKNLLINNLNIYNNKIFIDKIKILLFQN
ncbi:putative lipoyl transferase [Candidatus Zinderia insecticola CARI]|uniref:lipoyl(octanoyl) transferase n=1 Tax=Zinderia insecticola (strain CARI) TaxID=871271 RepID=E0TIL1_ZINIC|nr:putative lipoyl transferase [Candidatus Zinderia insecticola CARI]